MQRIIARIEKYGIHKYSTYVILFAFSIIVYNSFSTLVSDFEDCVYSSKMMFSELYGRLVYQPVELCSYVKYVLHIDGFYAGFSPNPPSIGLFFYPFTKLDIFYAKLIFNISSILLFIFSTRRLFNFYNINLLWLALLPLIFYFPFRSNIYFGQFYLLLFSLLAEALMALELKKYNLSALLLSLAIFFKVFPFLLVFYLFIDHPLKMTLKVLLFTFILFIISICIQGVEIWKIYLFEVFPRSNFGEIHASFSYYFQTVFSFCKMIFVYDELRNPQALFDNYLLFAVSVICLKSIIVIFTVTSTFKNKNNVLYNFSIWVICTLLLLPHSNTYTMILLLFILLYYLKYHTQNLLLLGTILLLIMFICWVPAYKMMHLAYILRYSKLIATLLLFIIVIKKEGYYLQLRPILIAFCLVLISSLSLFFKEKIISSKYVIVKDKPELISSLYIKENKLCYAYWSGDGETHVVTAITKPKKQMDEIKLVNNQLFFNNERITNTNDLKSSPVIVYNTIYYLSDYNQGYGFYTIRKYELEFE